MTKELTITVTKIKNSTINISNIYKFKINYLYKFKRTPEIFVFLL